MTKEGVHLYAKWVKQIKYSFELYYKDENNKDVLIKSYGANQNATFGSVYIDRAAAKAYPGHTFINFSDVMVMSLMIFILFTHQLMNLIRLLNFMPIILKVISL